MAGVSMQTYIERLDLCHREHEIVVAGEERLRLRVELVLPRHRPRDVRRGLTLRFRDLPVDGVLDPLGSLLRHRRVSRVIGQMAERWERVADTGEVRLRLLYDTA